jgi:Tol biopolymer transport system component
LTFRASPRYGTAVRQLTFPPRGTRDDDEWWSPDASTVVFQRSFPDGSSEIYTIRADGTGLKQLTHCDLAAHPYCFNGSPVWTPDGKTIVFSRCCIGPNGDVGLATMRSDGSHVHQLTLNPTCWGDFGPTVSPDGRWVAFSRVIPAAPGNCDQSVSALFLVHLDGSALHRITSYKLQVDEKDWSPDGSKIRQSYQPAKGSSSRPNS